MELEGNALVRQWNAAVAAGRLTDEEWHDRIGALRDAHYLAGETVYAQAGFEGGADRWRRERGVIATAIHRDGSFLDVGSANGLLMESVREWALACGRRLEPYGLDSSERLVLLARRRLPAWAERIFQGNALTWAPPRRFEFVRTELVCVPAKRQAALMRHLLDAVVAPGGRLIVCDYARRPAGGADLLGDELRGWGFRIAGQASAEMDEQGDYHSRIAWIDAPRGSV